MNNYKELAIRYAEQHGFYEFLRNDHYIEYWSLYEDGFHFFRVDLITEERTEVCNIEWHEEDGIPVPAFLKTATGATKYNYFCG